MSEPRKMLAIQITRKDGTSFLAHTGLGEGNAVWSPRNRKNAVPHKKELLREGLNARIVPILYTEPQVL
jgi:hypothetical protein